MKLTCSIRPQRSVSVPYEMRYAAVDASNTAKIQVVIDDKGIRSDLGSWTKVNHLSIVGNP